MYVITPPYMSRKNRPIVKKSAGEKLGKLCCDAAFRVSRQKLVRTRLPDDVHSWAIGSFAKRDKGVIMLEAAIVIPVLALTILGGFDLLSARSMKSNLDFLAREAAICAATAGCDAQSYINGSAAGLSLDPARIGTKITGKSVTLSYPFNPVGPVIPSITLQSAATIP
jgi:hypothetical protein